MDGGQQLAIEYRPIGSLIPYARNARTHSTAQVALIAGSIREFGWTNPVLVDGASGIIAGHGRVLAAQMLGMRRGAGDRAWAPERNAEAGLMCWRTTGWQNRQAGTGSCWPLRSRILTTSGSILRISVLTGRDRRPLAPGCGRSARGGRAAAVPEVPVSWLGDLWCLGAHRLICRDATNSAEVVRVLDGVRPHLMVIEPPYGVDYDPDWRNRAGASETKRTGKSA